MPIMERKVKESKFAKADQDVNDQDIITLITCGGDEESEFDGNKRVQFIIGIETVSGAEKLLGLNVDSFNNMFDVYGSDTDKWIGEKAKVTIFDVEVSGKMKRQIILTHPDGDPANPVPDGMIENKEGDVSVDEDDPLA